MPDPSIVKQEASIRAGSKLSMEVVEVMCRAFAGSVIRRDMAIGQRLATGWISGVQAVPRCAMDQHIAPFKSEKTRAEGHGVFVIVAPVEVHCDCAGLCFEDCAVSSSVDDDGGMPAVRRCMQAILAIGAAARGDVRKLDSAQLHIGSRVEIDAM